MIVFWLSCTNKTLVTIYGGAHMPTAGLWSQPAASIRKITFLTKVGAEERVRDIWFSTRI